MIASDMSKVFLLVVLLIVGGLAYYYTVGFEPVRAPTTAARTVSRAERPKELRNPEIQFDLIKDIAAENVGQKDLFHYRQPSALGKPREIVIVRGPFAPATPSDNPPVTTALPSLRTFRYEGFSLTKETRKILASLSEGGNNYMVEQGDYLLGQYLVTRITESLVEIEDVQQKSRTTFTIWQR